MKKTTLICFALGLSAQSFGQSLTQLWTGQQTPQPQSELPVGKAPFQTPVRKVKQLPTTNQPLVIDDWSLVIATGWQLGTNTQLIESGQSIFAPDFDTKDWYDATVPGTVLTTLVEQGVYPDPYFGLNNLAIPDTLCRMDWWYRNAFELPQNAGERVTLLFNGINYRAEIFLNGKKLGNITGAFIRGEFDVTSIIHRSGTNILVVHILPPNNPSIPHEQSIAAGQGLNGGALSIDGPTFIAAMGWDWIPGIRDRNIGIWQDVRLKFGGAVQIIDPQVITDLNLPDTTSAKITIYARLKNHSSQPVEGKLHAVVPAKAGSPRQTIELPYTLAANETKQVSFAPLQLKNPRLWWPNGYGQQNLYDLTITSYQFEQSAITPSDTKTVRFGIREMSYELMVHDTVQGNIRIAYSPTDAGTGKPLFNYEKRFPFSKEVQLPTLNAEATRALPLQTMAIDQNDPVGPFLVIRVNGVRIFCRGGNWGMDDAMKNTSREHLEPYLKLHQDMNFNIVRNWTGESTEETFYDLCDEYGMLVWNDFWITTDDTVEPNDQPLFMRNATDVVRRFRNHPSIAIWCPRNEGFAPKGLAQPLAEMLAKEDPTRHYHGQSRYLNMRTSGPWSYFDDPSKYYTQNAQGFNTEMGTYAVPTASTIRKFIAPEDQWPINDVWAYHDLHATSQNYKGFIQAVNRYGEPTGMVDFTEKAQLVCYDAWRNMLEAWNSKMWNTTTGLILWMSHPAWPSMIWQTYSYDYETPGSYFGAKKACEPLHIQMNKPHNDIVVINTTRQPANKLTAIVRIIDLNGKEIDRQSTTVNANSNSLTGSKLAVKNEGLPDAYLVRLELKNQKGKTISTNDYWQGNEAEIAPLLHSQGVVVQARNDASKRVLVTVANPTSKIAASIKLNAVDKTTGEIILPAYFSDGYFNLLPGETRQIEATFDIAANPNFFITFAP
ncbi:glycosyl hydrolase [Bacteroidia bacterium]|nr:glycosyl hydrolase [Bacteroidia bacterium]